jgi:hypothetical protein
MGLKGFSLISTQNGLVVYGGMYWQETNITYMDEIYASKNAFYDKCRGIMI